jgi:hypothetical protein
VRCFGCFKDVGKGKLELFLGDVARRARRPENVRRDLPR